MTEKQRLQILDLEKRQAELLRENDRLVALLDKAPKHVHRPGQWILQCMDCGEPNS